MAVVVSSVFTNCKLRDPLPSYTAFPSTSARVMLKGEGEGEGEGKGKGEGEGEGLGLGLGLGLGVRASRRRLRASLEAAARQLRALAPMLRRCHASTDALAPPENSVTHSRTD